MDSVRFEYRKVEDPTKCKFIASTDTKTWECEIDLPFEYGDSFWELRQSAGMVIDVSRDLAIKNNAPKWVYNEKE